MDLKMEVYSPSLELLGVHEAHKSVIWEEKAFSAGSFSIEALIASESLALLQPENIIWIEGNTAGIIEYVQETVGVDGPYITVKGRDLTGILGRRILWGPYNLKGTPPAIMCQLVDDCCINPTRGDMEARKIPGLVLLDVPTEGDVIQFQKTGGTLLEVLEQLGETYGVAFGVRFNPAVPRMEFWTRWGRNLTVHQSDNPQVLYSTELDDVLESEYSYNAQDWRNVSLVAGGGEGSDRVYVTVENEVEDTPDVPVNPPVPSDPIKYTVTLLVDPAGGGMVSGGKTVVAGTSITVTAAPSDGYTFSGWNDGEAVVSADIAYTFIVTGNRTLTAMFAVKNVSRLPEGYTEIEYISLEGDKTSFQLLDAIDCATDRLVFKFRVDGVGSSKRMLFFGNSTGSNYIYLTPAANNSLKYQIGTSSKTVTISIKNNILNFDLNCADGVYAVNGVTLSGTKTTASIGESTRSLGTPTVNPSNQSAEGDFFVLTHYRDGEIIHDYVPCVSPDLIAGIFDINSETFIRNTMPGATAVTPGPPIQ